MKPKYSVVLPVYNELDNLIPLINEIDQALRPLGSPYEILAVDDASTDGSAELLEKEVKTRNSLRLIRFRANSGQTAALSAGLRFSQGEIVITLDSDRQNDPMDIPMMLTKLESERFDCVHGWRKNRKDGVFLRKIPSWIANRIIRRLWKSNLHDLGCSLKVFRREVAQDLKLYGEMHRLMGILIQGTGAKVCEVNVNHRPRVAGYSKYNLSRTVKVLLDLFTVWFLQRYWTKPIYLFGGIGALMISGCMGFFSVAGYDKLVLGISVHRNPLFLIAIFLGVIACQFIVMGLLAELLTRTYFESTQHFPYTIAKMCGFPLTALDAPPSDTQARREDRKRASVPAVRSRA